MSISYLGVPFTLIVVLAVALLEAYGSRITRGLRWLYARLFRVDRQKSRLAKTAERLRLPEGVYFSPSDPKLHVMVDRHKVCVCDGPNAWYLLDQPDLSGSGIGLQCVSHGRVVGTVHFDLDSENHIWIGIQKSGVCHPRRGLTLAR
ncbi:MAG: hypothetical protein AAF750_04840 [Planctomycetota bacterium]